MTNYTDWADGTYELPPAVKTTPPEVQTVANEAKVQVVNYSPGFKAFCSLGNAPFGGVALITFEPDDKLLEFMSFEEFIHELTAKPTTIEELTRAMFDELVRVLGDIPVRVQVMTQTAVHAPAGATISQGEFKHDTQNYLGYRGTSGPIYWLSGGG